MKKSVRPAVTRVVVPDEEAQKAAVKLLIAVTPAKPSTASTDDRQPTTGR